MNVNRPSTRVTRRSAAAMSTSSRRSQPRGVAVYSATSAAAAAAAASSSDRESDNDSDPDENADLDPTEILALVSQACDRNTAREMRTTVRL